MANNKSVILGIILSFFTLSQGYGMKYKILLLNTPSITIDNKEAKVGDWFDDECEITWSNDNQAMKVISEDNHRYTVSPSAYKRAKAKKFKNYILDVKPMAHRGVYSLKEELEDRLEGYHVMMDEIVFDLSGIELSKDYKFSVKLKENEHTFPIELSLEDNTKLILQREVILSSLNEFSNIIELFILLDDEPITNSIEVEIIQDYQ